MSNAMIYCRTCRDWRPPGPRCPVCGDSRRGYVPVRLSAGGYARDDYRSDPGREARLLP